MQSEQHSIFMSGRARYDTPAHHLEGCVFPSPSERPAGNKTYQVTLSRSRTASHAKQHSPLYIVASVEWPAVYKLLAPTTQ
jgi:hypothetical protein